jgi:hypothetical protein
MGQSGNSTEKSLSVQKPSLPEISSSFDKLEFSKKCFTPNAFPGIAGKVGGELRSSQGQVNESENFCNLIFNGAKFFRFTLACFSAHPCLCHRPGQVVRSETKKFMKNSNSSNELLELLKQELEAMLLESRIQFFQTEARIQAWIEIVQAVLK